MISNSTLLLDHVEGGGTGGAVVQALPLHTASGMWGTMEGRDRGSFWTLARRRSEVWLGYMMMKLVVRGCPVVRAGCAGGGRW